MQGSIFSAIGSACNDARDAQNWTLPAILPVLLPLLMMVPILKEPNSFFSTTMSLIPPFTPMLMLARQSAPGGIPPWQPWIGLVGVLCFTSLCVYVGGRIFRVGILMQGKPPKLKDLIRWAVNG
jgi:ABC-type Na+ efflux pump permease subunit